jgi:transmembrane sensor
VEIEAWRFGEAIFNATPLSEAITEMNRYDRRQIGVADEALGRRPISGRYETGDNEAFAHSVGLLFGEEVRVTPDQIVIG